MVITISDFLEFSPFDNKINADFLRQIYGKQTLGDSCFNKEEEFWNRFYFNNIDLFSNTTELLIGSINKSNIHFILFKGPSGSGKTTYLKQIIKNEKDYFKDISKPPFFDVVNLIERSTSSITDPTLLISVLHSKILEIIDSRLICELYDTIAESGKLSPLKIENATLLMHSYSEFVDLLGGCKDEFSLKSIVDFLTSVKEVSDVIALYIIFYTFKHCLKEKRPSVFIFDNLDELESKYLVRTLITDIRDAFSKAQGFFDNLKNTETIAGDYDFISNCTLIESVRDGFVGDVNSCQLEERLKGRSITIQYDKGFRNSLYEISNKRIQLFKEYLQTIKQLETKNGVCDDEVEMVGNNEDTSGAIDNEIINNEIVEDEKKYIEELGRLFNYDYRITLSFLSEALKEDISAWEMFAKQDPDCRLGIRGLLLFYILKSLYMKDTAFTNYVLTELRENRCNRNRMYLSLLTNMYDNEMSKRAITESLHVPLGDFTKRVRTWYDNIAVSSIYNTLFVSNNNNFSLPASLEGQIIEEYFRKKQYDVTLKGLCEYVAEIYKDDPDRLNEVSIVVNPVCLEYTQRVFINYEYFNLISVANRQDYDFLYGAKSLFQYDAYDDIELCLKRVFNVARTVIQRADDHVCGRCGLHCSNIDIRLKEQMCTSQVKFLDDNNFLIMPNTLYKTRVITQHINYLDSFRKLLWLKYHQNNQEKNEVFQRLLLSYINKYIGLFRDSRVINSSAEETMKKIEKNYKKAQKKGYMEWYSVSIGRG